MTPFSERMTGLRTNHGNACVICEAVSDLEFAHLTPTSLSAVARGRGGNNRIADITNHPDAYVLMCRSCHLRFDAFVRQSKRLRNLIRAQGVKWYLGKQV